MSPRGGRVSSLGSGVTVVKFRACSQGTTGGGKLVNRFGKLNLVTKLVILILFAASVPVAVGGYLSFQRARDGLQQFVFLE